MIEFLFGAPPKWLRRLYLRMEIRALRHETHAAAPKLFANKQPYFWFWLPALTFSIACCFLCYFLIALVGQLATHTAVAFALSLASFYGSAWISCWTEEGRDEAPFGNTAELHVLWKARRAELEAMT